MRYVIKPMDIGEVLDQALELLKNHLKLFLQIACILYAPSILVVQVVTQIFAPSEEAVQYMAYDETINSMLMLLAVAMGGLLLVGLIIYPISLAAIVRAISDEYLGQPTTPLKALKEALPIAFPLVVTIIIVRIITFFGYLFCIVPGVYLACRYYLIVPVAVLENRYFGDALGRSWSLTDYKGHVLTAFVLVFILWLIEMFSVYSAAFIPVPFIAIPLQVLAQTGVLILTAAVTVVFYFSCRCNVENFDLALLAQKVGQQDYQGQPETGVESVLRTPEYAPISGTFSQGYANPESTAYPPTPVYQAPVAGVPPAAGSPYPPPAPPAYGQWPQAPAPANEAAPEAPPQSMPGYPPPPPIPPRWPRQ